MAQQHKFQGTARKVVTDDQGTTSFYYHNTAVVQRFADGSIQLNSGGWRTNTTKTAMNQASNEHGLGIHMYQKRGQWLVSMGGSEVPFSDGMILVKRGSGGLLAVSRENVLTTPDGATTPRFDTLNAAKAAALMM